jgi:hypothetical protein
MENRIRSHTAALLVAGVLCACSPAQVLDPVTGTGGSGGASQPSSTGGRGTPGPAAGSGGSGGEGAGTGGGLAGTGGARPPDAGGPRDTAAPRPPDSRPPPPDAPRPPPPDAAPEPDAPDPADAPPIAGSDAGTVVPSDGGIALCFSNPRVVAICRQLEPACENCPPGGAPPGNPTAQECFDLVARAKAGMATDAECVKFFQDRKCTVDNGGNVCGSLNCAARGCNAAMCSAAFENGDTVACMRFAATCPCR